MSQPAQRVKLATNTCCLDLAARKVKDRRDEAEAFGRSNRWTGAPTITAPAMVQNR